MATVTQTGQPAHRSSYRYSVVAMASIFSKIISERLGHFVYEDSECVAFMDIRPATPGHCLVVPRIEIDEWTDADPEIVAHLMEVAQKVGQAQKQVFDFDRVGLLIAGFEVAHCHIHVLPANSMADFEVGKVEAPAELLASQAAELSEAIANLA